MTLKHSLPSPGGPGGSELTSLGEFPGVYRAWLYQNVALTVWLGAVTVESLPGFEARYLELRKRFPEGISTVHIMLPGGRVMPSAEARAGWKRIADIYAPFLIATAVVILGNGFFVSAMRSLLTALRVAGFSGRNFRIDTSFNDVVGWLPDLHCQSCGVMLGKDELRAVMEQVLQLAS